MFGNWQSGEALIVERKMTGPKGGNIGVAASGTNIKHHYIGDVQSAGGAPVFRATWTDHGKSGYAIPKPGQRVPVKFQAKSQKVKIDYENWTEGELNRIVGIRSKDAAKEQWDATARAAPGSDAALYGEHASTARQRQERTPEELRAALAQRARGAGGEAPSPADEIAKLAALRDSGALTEDEFQAQKKRVLGD